MALSYSILLILLVNFLVQVAAGPQTVQAGACEHHGGLHHKLDAVEKRVEDTVEKLEDELALLLKTIEAPQWSPLLDTGGPVVDILESQEKDSLSV